MQIFALNTLKKSPDVEASTKCDLLKYTAETKVL